MYVAGFTMQLVRPYRFAVICACVVALFGLSPKAEAQNSKSRQDQNSRGTGVEGSLRVVSTTDAVEVKELLVGWQRLYPQIQVDYIHKASLEVFDSVITCETNSTCPDISWSSAMDLQIKLVNDGYAQPYPSRELSSVPDWAVWRNEAYGITAEPIAVVYNKALVPPGDVPRTHADLIKLIVEKRDFYKGKIASYDPELSGTGFLFLTNDLQVTTETWNLARAFGQVGIKLYTYGHTILDRIASGEHLIAYNMIASYALARANEDPSIGVIMLSDYTLQMTRIALIPKAARHPNAARLFLDYLLSQEGQRQLALRSFGTVRSDVPNPMSEMQQITNLRPIHVGPDLLTYLDQAKRKSFFREWRRALEAR
jgi:iron(III) transport system substrate-binding protein